MACIPAFKPKRPAVAMSDGAIITPDPKLASCPCVRCGCTKDLVVSTIRTAKGTLRARLCERCNSWKPDLELCVLSEFDVRTGLPIIEIWDEYTSEDKLGVFKRRDQFKACTNCSSTAAVAKALPLKWIKGSGWDHDTSVETDLCRYCRHCMYCSVCVSGDFIVLDAELCDRCAHFCTWCEIVCDARHFQNLGPRGGNSLCKNVCCKCRAHDVFIRHPTSDRGYCRDCAETKQPFYDKGDDDDDCDENRASDLDGWDVMMEKLHEKILSEGCTMPTP